MQIKDPKGLQKNIQLIADFLCFSAHLPKIVYRLYTSYNYETVKDRKLIN